MSSYNILQNPKYQEAFAVCYCYHSRAQTQSLCLCCGGWKQQGVIEKKKLQGGGRLHLVITIMMDSSGLSLMLDLDSCRLSGGEGERIGIGG